MNRTGTNARLEAARPSRRRGVRHGFTLMEMLLVVAILTTIAAIGVPRYANALSNYRAQAAARKIVADIQLARSRAMMLSASQTMTFNTATHQYQIVGMADLDRPTAAYITSLADEPYRASFKTVAFGNSTSLVFNGYGVPASGGTIVVTAGNASKTITVNASTGEASFP